MRPGLRSEHSSVIDVASAAFVRMRARLGVVTAFLLKAYFARWVKKCLERIADQNPNSQLWVLRVDKIGHQVLHSRALLAFAQDRASIAAHEDVVFVAFEPIANWVAWDYITVAGSNLVRFEVVSLTGIAEKLFTLRLPRRQLRNLVYPAVDAAVETIQDASRSGGRFVDAEGIAIGKYPNLIPTRLVGPVKLAVDHGELGFQRAATAGLGRDDRVAVVIDRDSAFYGELSALRNTRMDDLSLVIDALLRAGYFVVRLGSHRLEQVPCDDSRFLDYPFWHHRSPEMEVFFAAIAEVCIAFNTGLATLPGLFGVPTAVLSVGLPESPVPLDYLFFSLQTLQRQTGDLLSIEELYASAHGPGPDQMDPAMYEAQTLNAATCDEIVRWIQAFGHGRLSREASIFLEDCSGKAFAQRHRLHARGIGALPPLRPQPCVFLPLRPVQS